MDIFDRIAQEDPDIFDEVQDEQSAIDRVKKEFMALLNNFDSKERKQNTRQMTDEVKALIKEEIARIKPTQKVIEKTLEKQVVKNIHVPVQLPPPPPAPPPQKIKEIVKEVRIEAPKDTKKYAEEKYVEDLKKQIEDLKAELQNVRETLPFLHGGSGVSKSNDVYNPVNITPTRSFDATSTSIDEIAHTLGSLIQSLQGIGFIK